LDVSGRTCVALSTFFATASATSDASTAALAIVTSKSTIPFWKASRQPFQYAFAAG
jgi:hypothetical protein